MELKTDEYISGRDDLSYKELIEIGEVKNETGKVYVRKHTVEDIFKIKRMSVVGIDYVISGRGSYRAWKSNLQKMVRRGKVREALRSVYETISMGGQFLSNIVNRLCKVMVSEECGPGEPWMAKICCEFLEYYEKNKRGNELEKDISFQINILLLTKMFCLARKTRISCLMKNYFNNVVDQKIILWDWDKLFEEFISSVEEDDFNLGSQMLLRLIDNGSKLERGEKLGELEEYQKKLFGRKRKKIYIIWKYILDRSEKLDKRLWEINLYLLKIYIMSESSLNLTNAYCNLMGYLQGRLDLKKPDLLEIKDGDNFTWEEVKKWKDIWIDSVSYDRHTKVGAELGRDWYFFYRYGAKIFPKYKGFEDLDNFFYISILKRITESEN